MKINFYWSLLTISLISLVAHYFIFQYLGFDWNQWMWALYLYFPITTLLIHRVLSKKVAGRPQTFVTSFMGSMAAKLFISLILLLVVLYSVPSIKIPFALSFLYLYLLYTSLNTYYIFSQLKGN
jgi:hypothetical protein